MVILNIPLVADDYYWFSPSVTEDCWTYFFRDMLPNDPDALFLRPLPILVFSLESHLQGLSPLLPRILNVSFHLLTTALVGLLITLPGRKGKTTGRDMFALVTGMLIFALHPQATGAVCWVSALFDLMCGFFGAAGVYAWLSSTSKSHFSCRRLLAILAFALSILSKETGVIFPVAIFLWQLWLLASDSDRTARNSRIIAASQLSILLVAYFVYRISVLGGMGGYSHFRFGYLNLSDPAGYGLVMFWPFAHMGPVPSMAIYCTLVAVGAGMVWAANWMNGVWDHPRKYPWVLPLLLGVLPLGLFLPSRGFLTIRQVLEHAEARYSYVSLISFAILMAWLFERCRDLRAGRWITPAFLTVFLCFLSWGQQVEISRWAKAGRMAESILTQTVALVPSPNDNAALIFHGIPLGSERWYYVFGMGLPEALSQRYGRSDLQVVRWPERDVFENPPDNSYILKFDHTRSTMELIHPPEPHDVEKRVRQANQLEAILEWYDKH